jgi:hypothetical protein
MLCKGLQNSLCYYKFQVSANKHTYLGREISTSTGKRIPVTPKNRSWESKLPPDQGTGGVSRGTTLVDHVSDPLYPTADWRSGPWITPGRRSLLLVYSTFTWTAPEGTSLDFHLAGSQSMPLPPCWIRTNYFPLSKPLLIVPIIGICYFLSRL